MVTHDNVMWLGGDPKSMLISGINQETYLCMCVFDIIFNFEFKCVCVM